MPAAGPQNTRARQRRRPRPMVPHGPGGQMLRPAPRPRPVPTVRQRALAQERAYRSQGRTIPHVAKRQRRAAVRRKLAAPERYFRSQGQAIERQANALDKRASRVLAGQRLREIHPPTRGVYDPREVQQLAGLIDAKGVNTALRQFKVAKEQRDAESKAHALRILDQVMRPGYGSAGAARALVMGKGVGGALKGASRGLQLKDRYLYSDVLKEAGVKNKTVRGIAGFIGDVALDPTTYLTFGATSVGAKAAAKAATRAGEAAVKQEARKLAPRVARGTITPRQARREAKIEGQQVARKTLERAHAEGKTAGPKGLTVKVAGGKHVRKAIRRAGLESERAPLAPLTRASIGGRRAGAFVSAPVRGSAGAKATSEFLRAAGSEAHAGIRPGDLSRRQNVEVKDVRREQQAQAGAVGRRVVARANALLGRLSEAEQRQVIDAIEADRIGRLRGEAENLPAPKTRPITAWRSRKTRKDPDRLFLIARDLRSDLRHLNRTGRRAGVLAGQVGTKGVTREEVQLAAKATRGRSTAAVRAALKPALRDRALARTALARATTPAKKRAARETLKRADARVANLRKPVQREAESKQARQEIRAIRQRRFGKEGEARGFFPRARERDLEDRNPLLPRHADEPTQPGGAKAGTQMRREYRKSRVALERGTKDERRVAAGLSPDVRKTMERYGSSIARAASVRELNTKLIRSGTRVPKLTKAEFRAMQEDAPQSIYRVRRGEAPEKVTDYAQATRAASRHPAAGRAPGRGVRGGVGARAGEATKGMQAQGQRRATGGGGQYAVLDDAVVRRARHRTAPVDTALGRGYDFAQGKFKTVALATPGYLVRNVLGDAFNAAVHENPFTLARNALKSQKALNALGRYEKSNRIFERKLPQKLKTIKLTPEQAAALGTTKTEMPALQAAFLAEENGVIRQGRFLELMEEGGRPKGTHAWQDTVKRAEDSIRMVTFMASLQRGALPREAARRASKVHFDYSDLTDFEKRGLRRLMPFYTFTSRNLPLQAQAVATRPGRYATVQKGREEGRKQSGLPVGFEGSLNPYEARQLGLPVKIGDKTFTLSTASPFTDLNDVIGTGNPIETGTKRIGEMMSPFVKTAPEMIFNLSLFYRDQIERKDEPLTRAPDWAVAMGKAVPGFKKLTGMVDNYLPAEGAKPGGVPGWGRKADYFFRQSAPGPITPLLDAASLGVPGANARSMEKWQRLLAAAGPRVIEYDKNKARVEGIYNRLDRIEKEINRTERRTHPTLRSPEGRAVRINREHPTPAYTKLADEQKRLSDELDQRLREARPGGLVGGEEVPTKQAPRTSSSSRRIAPTSRRIAPSSRRIAPSSRRIVPR